MQSTERSTLTWFPVGALLLLWESRVHAPQRPLLPAPQGLWDPPPLRSAPGSTETDNWLRIDGQCLSKVADWPQLSSLLVNLWLNSVLESTSVALSKLHISSGALQWSNIIAPNSEALYTSNWLSIKSISFIYIHSLTVKMMRLIVVQTHVGFNNIMDVRK